MQALKYIESLREFENLKAQGYTAHDYQTSRFVQELVPFLKEVESTITRMQSQIEYLENRVADLDRLSDY